MTEAGCEGGHEGCVACGAMTEAGAWRNAVRTLYAMGGSSNAVLHLLALARSVSRHSPPLTIDDFERLGKDVSHRVGMPSACV